MSASWCLGVGEGQLLVRPADTPATRNLCSRHSTSGHLEHTSDCRRIDWVFVSGHVAHPTLQREGGDRLRRDRQSLRIGRVEFARLPGELDGRPTCMLGRTNEERSDVSAGDIIEQRHDLVTNTISHEGRIGVARVIEHIPPESSADLDRVAPPERQNRSSWPRCHRAEPDEPRPTDEVDDDGLGLIVRRVSGGAVRAQHVISRCSHSSLEIRARGDHYGCRLEVSADRIAVARDSTSLLRS